MAKYIVLRDCFCHNDQFFYGGSVVELPDGLDKEYPKNFKLITETSTTTHPIADTIPAGTMTVADIAVATPFFRDNETTGSGLDWANAEVYVSDKPKVDKPKTKKRGK
jgi:hypothetical protein